ncbi:MAG: hypothetical protein J7641_13350 [Cyanobacteria bacterium SID2]|nr:hypothetical protein [Cyanobacteria bacterium SID2]MBP0006624.1 hypothetical protein [Cyanobacteria bacterium SBC]
MKRFAIALFSICLVSNVATPVARSRTNPLDPFQLATMAYQGYFSEQGIASHGQLVSHIENRQVEAEDIVRAAIDRGLLTAEALNDKEYLELVEFQLHHLNLR